MPCPPGEERSERGFVGTKGLPEKAACCANAINARQGPKHSLFLGAQSYRRTQSGEAGRGPPEQLRHHDSRTSEGPRVPCCASSGSLRLSQLCLPGSPSQS